MSDSIELYNGLRNIDVNTLDILREPNQQLANAIATGPQDEFFSKLEECNRVFPERIGQLSVTPSWNWKPGTFDMVKNYVSDMLMLNKKSSGFGKYISRSQENARYRLSWLATKLRQCEDLKRMLKKEGFQLNVDIDEYVIKLIDFCNKLEESISQATQAADGKVTFTPYIHIPQNNERLAMFYIDCYVNPGEMNVCQDSELIQKIPITGLKIMFNCPLRQMMRYLEKPSSRFLNVQYRGLNDSKYIGRGNYRTSQETFHPYTAPPSSSDYENVTWATVCFSNFTDNVRKAFHELNFVVLSMELLEWAGYFNTSHANPYNPINTIHFGMPSSFSREYQAVTNRDTSNCSTRLSNKMFSSKARDFSIERNLNKVEFVKHCQIGIKCIWRDDCHAFKLYANQLANIADEENVSRYESILGALIEHWDEKSLINLLYEDFGCYVDDSLPEENMSDELRRTILYDYEDVLNFLIMSVNSIDLFEYLFKEIKYWGDNKEIKVVEDVIPNNDKIREQMLQWATERGV